MGACIDTVAGFITNSAALANATVAPGDTLAVRNFQDGAAFARLEAVIFKGTAARTIRITSPMLHDVSRGLTFISAQAPTQINMPQDVGQPLHPGDTLSVALNSGAADSSAFALQNYYSDLPGIAARLHSWGEVAPLIKNLKPLQVAAAASATVGNWNDTGLTATESLLHASVDYAVLGYQVDVAVTAVALRGSDTGNFRIGGPGSVLQDTTADYFIDLDARHSGPHIPVINAQNAAATVTSVVDNAAGTAVNVQWILAELSSNLSG